MEKSLQFELIAAHLNPSDTEEWVRLAEMSLEQDNIKQAIFCYAKGKLGNLLLPCLTAGKESLVAYDITPGLSLQPWSTILPTCATCGSDQASTSSWGSTNWRWTATGAFWIFWPLSTAIALCIWQGTWPSKCLGKDLNHDPACNELRLGSPIRQLMKPHTVERFVGGTGFEFRSVVRFLLSSIMNSHQRLLPVSLGVTMRPMMLQLPSRSWRKPSASTRTSCLWKMLT